MLFPLISCTTSGSNHQHRSWWLNTGEPSRVAFLLFPNTSQRCAEWNGKAVSRREGNNIKPELASQYKEGNAVDGQLSLSGCAVTASSEVVLHLALDSNFAPESYFHFESLQLWQTAVWGTRTMAGAKDIRGTWPFLSGFATGKHLLCQHILQGWQCKHWILCSSLNNA